MKKILFMVVVSALACACTKEVEIVDPYSQGVCVGEIHLGATAGKVSLSVETEGVWRVESDQSWLRTDVNGRKGNGAFTVYYESNQSDVHEIRQARVAKVAVRIEDLQEVVLVCCSSEGSGDVNAWIDAQNADVVVLDGQVNGEVSGLNVVGCDFAGMTVEEEFEAFRATVQKTYNSGPDAGDDWIYAGQMYHLSSMQTDYDKTPEWYPQTTSDPRLRSDIYAWQNNLYDCVWMYRQDYISTWTDAEGNGFCADYVYASVSVFAKVESVELIEVEGLAHKAIKVTLKY